MMNKSELTSKVYASVKEGDIASKAAADRVVTAVLNAIKDEVAVGNEVALANFGTFKTAQRSEKTGVNPQTKEKITIPAKVVPKFVPGKAFKDAVGGNK